MLIPTVLSIQLAVCDHYGLPMSAMFSDIRERRYARPRQVGMYLSRRMSGMTYPQIGRHFGKRDHTTVMHAVRQIERLCDSDKDLERSVMALADRLMGVA